MTLSQCSLIAAPKDRVSTIHEVQSLKFYREMPFKGLRQMAAPFVPMLDNETDVGYFDSFNSPEDMAKYAEVFKKQADVEAVAERGRGEKNAWVGFTFGRNANVGREIDCDQERHLIYVARYRFPLSLRAESPRAKLCTPCSRSSGQLKNRKTPVLSTIYALSVFKLFWIVMYATPPAVLVSSS